MRVMLAFVHYGFLVIAPNLQPAQNRGVTFARCVGISPSLARSWRSGKLERPSGGASEVVPFEDQWHSNEDFDV